MTRLLFISLLLAFGGVHIVALGTGLRLDQSRLVFQADQSQHVVTLENDSDTVYLIQANLRQGAIDGPISPQWLVTPPLFRLAPHSQQTVKILPQMDLATLPRDRESLFYFSATALPALPKRREDTSSLAQISVATRLVIKLFYRPQGLSLSSEQAASHVTFTQRPGVLCVNNPSPYYLTFSEMVGDGTPLAFPAGLMLAPYHHAVVPTSTVLKHIQWRTINDYGGNSIQFQAQVQTGGNKC